MKKIICLILFVLTGCAQLQHGQIQPVIIKDAKQQIMFTSCGGAVEDWASCFNKASNACTNGYSVISKNEDTRGVRRELTFQCKK